MPASDDAFEKSKPMPTGSLDQAMKPGGVAGLQSFGAIVLTATLFGRNLLHLHRPGLDDRDSDLNGGFWSRHRDLENILLNTSLSLPDHLRLPSGLPDPNVIFANMCLHTSAICLHQAAIFKADKYRLPVNVSNESKVRCVTAAAEIASVMKMISHMDLSAVSILDSFFSQLSLTHIDESFHIILCLCRSAGVRPVPQDAAKRPTDEFVSTVPLASHAGTSSEEPSHGVVLGATRPRP
jgi:hypothetical protein